MANDTILSCTQFTQFLVDQTPVFDKEILMDIRPTDGWIGHMSMGQFPSYSGTEHTLDRFNAVFPDTTQQWNRVYSTGCVGTPCDKTEHCIGWGAERITYYLEEQSWATNLLCFDKDMHITHAKEQYRQIISDILKPATSAIMSQFMRKRALTHAGKKWIADANQTEFTFAWVLSGTSETFLDVSALPTSKLTPQMLQRRVARLMGEGYFGKQPFKDMPPLIELVSDMETVWDLDRSVSLLSIGDKWRFSEWDAANKYYRYGFSGQLGNYATRVDPLGMRFNYRGQVGVGGTHRFQIVLPYRNVASSGAGGEPGIKSEYNPDYDRAQYGISFIWHKKGMEALVSDATPINPEMPFSSRNFGGKWQFVMDNLGSGPDGCVIENKRRNKGQFIADFKLAIKPRYTEFVEAIFHKRERACVIEIDTCATDPGYPTQDYDSCNTACD